MPEGLSPIERIRWKKAHPDWVDPAKGNPKGKPAVASKELDKDMPDEIRKGTKLQQLKWRKKHAQEQAEKSQSSE